MTEPDEIDKQLDEWLAAEAPVAKEEEEPKKASDLIRKCIHKLEESTSDDSLVIEFRQKLRVVLDEELASFRRTLTADMKEANRIFLKTFREQTDRILLQSAKSAAIRTKEFVERTMATICENDGDGSDQ